MTHAVILTRFRPEPWLVAHLPALPPHEALQLAILLKAFYPATNYHVEIDRDGVREEI